MGDKQPFLTMHVYFPALLEVVKYHQGLVIDMMGDGFVGGRFFKLRQL